ncbi:MAG: BlaI/MecI/CopY family transcriptional regulator [Planctomycetes bacterium]|nr:BlaI/MecI/CopY family transcriptional regulator [Planctomycetota bacterium]
MRNKLHLAELQLAIMQVLWDRGEATVAEVQADLAESRPLAYTTVGTMLTKMEQNGQVAHRTLGRVNVYRPAVKREKVRRSMLSDLAARLFGGDVTELVSHLLDAGEVSPAELARLKRLIRDKEQELRDAE